MSNLPSEPEFEQALHGRSNTAITLFPTPLYPIATVIEWELSSFPPGDMDRI